MCIGHGIGNKFITEYYEVFLTNENGQRQYGITVEKKTLMG